ncbi:DUF423 domain-containing protein [Aneurinibacillus tyrosinisolvens]|uniref:DUF423 domain-containing protein n=1 Tax=Aneurinibacillus tyrosinisolvens TaxID=1443435 RepID=UPI00063FA4D2|nr:DUF423 domain-containing protein [Aneurinibacillus tyrosinisolvens]
MGRLFIFLGSINLFLSVALGAFGAHGLRGRITEGMLAVYQTGVYYHMVHGLGLLIIGLLAERVEKQKLISWAGWLLQIGIILFSFSLYALAVTGISKLGIITPFGGVAFLSGWILVAIAALKR